MRILLVTLEYPPQEGGVASYYAGLVQELRRHGYEVEVVSDDGIYLHNPPLPPLKLRGGRSFLLFRFVWPRWLKAYLVIKKQIKKNSPDLILVGNLLPLGTVAYLLRGRAPYVIFTHGMDVLMAQKSLRKKWIARKILQRAKIVVANSEFTKNQIKNWKLKIEPIVLYPCPNIVFEIRREDVEALRRRLGLTGKRVLLTLGRVVERKGHDLAVKALPEILRRFPNTVYVVAGDGPRLPHLIKLVENDPLAKALSFNVRFVGKISDEEKSLYYALCDLFVMPSRQIGSDVEGFGLSFLEAALFDKPSIGGWSGGVAEAILNNQTGLLVDPEDSSALAKDITRLLDDDVLRKELGHNAKARVLREFTWEKQTRVLINRIDHSGHMGV